MSYSECSFIFIDLVSNILVDEFDFHFLSFGHTKFNVDMMFGMIQARLAKAKILTMEQLKYTNNYVQDIEAKIYDASGIRGWHGASKFFRSFPNIRKMFYINIRVIYSEHSAILVSF